MGLGMNLALWLERTAARDGARPALFSGTQAVATYAEFYERARGVAGWLREQKVMPGDRVAIYMPNCPDYLILLWGVWCAGAVAVPINAKLHPREACFILDNAEARLVFVDAALAEPSQKALDEACQVVCHVPQAEAVANPEPRRAEDLAWLFYTSGTTGKPKGVMITFGMLMAMALSYTADVDQISPDDCAIYAAPLSHGAGLYNIMHVQHGCRHVCPVSAGFDAAEVFDLAARFGRAHMFAAPTMVTRMTAAAKAAGRNGQGLRTVVYAGGPMYLPDILEARAVFGDIFVQIYGQGECPMAITALLRADVAGADMARLASVGRAQSCVEVAVVDQNGVSCAVGDVGEIAVRGAAVMPGYWRNPQATASTLINGWLHTGDVGTLDAAGYLTLLDRSKDVIITGGSNVYPSEVEQVLLQHAEVSEVSVIGRQHPDWGEEVVACIVGTASEAELDALCRAQIARFKTPKAYVRLDALPKNNYGKVLKTELRRLV